MSDGLVDFLRARLDDEQTARAAGGRWLVLPGKNWVTAPSAKQQPDPDHRVAVAPRTKELIHIARHDPARVLREVDAKRDLIRLAFEYAASVDEEWGCGHNADQIAAGHCAWLRPDELTTLRLLALPYQAHPDFRPEWAPTE